MDWKAFFDRLGLNGTRWQWRIMKWERNLKSLRQGNPSASDWSATKVLIGINLLLFLIMVVQGLLGGLGMSALLRPGGYLLVHSGAQYWPLVLTEGEWWRCLTYAFTHGGLIHLAFNMMVLYQVGPMIEEEIGTVRFVILYVLTALTATLAGLVWQVLWVKQWVTVVGASGSLFGLIGFAITYFHRVGGPMAHTYRNFMFKWAVIAFVFGLLIGADNAGHLGGAVGGALFGLVLPIGVRGRRVMRPFFNGLGVLCILLTVVSLLMLVVSWVV
ncbi:MAG: rhomboid family intramembrane serine protease [Desulfuromonadales bacterium]|jgi:rhomboid protease GluP